MKSLPLEKIRHIQLEKGFKNWLELTGYAATSVYGMPNYIREF
jgi:integrase/recombinase XerD